MNLKDYETSAATQVAKHNAAPGTNKEKYIAYRKQLANVGNGYSCRELIDYSKKLYIKHGDATERVPEIDETINLIKQVSLQKTFDLLELPGSKLGNSMLRGLSQRRVMIYFTSVGTEKGKDHGMLFRPGTWNEKTEQFEDGAIFIDNNYVGNYIGIARVIAHEFRHLLDCEETKWKNVRDQSGKLIRKKLDIGINWSQTDYGLNNDVPQERAIIFSGGLVAELEWKIRDKYGKTICLWTQLGVEEKKRLAKIWGPNWDGRYTTSGLCTEMDKSMELFLEKFYRRKTKIRARTCGRLCKNKEYGICDRKVRFPPCYDHR